MKRHHIYFGRPKRGRSDMLPNVQIWTNPLELYVAIGYHRCWFRRGWGGRFSRGS